MGRKKIKTLLISALILIAFVSSISIDNLEEVRSRAAHGEFDAAAYAQEFWNDKLMPNLSEAIETTQLYDLLGNDPERAFTDYSEALGIGNIRFFMVRGEGKIAQIDEDNITVLLTSEEEVEKIKIATEYIFGNAVRDASGKINLQEFDQTMDFNMVSAEINKLVRQEVLPVLKEEAEVGKQVRFVGAMELNKEQVDLENTEIIPVFIEFRQEEKDSSNE